MATEKTLKTRVKMKHGKESEWALATKFTPLIGEIIVYDVDNNHTSPRFKVGDGLTNVNNLKFVNQDELAKITTLGDELLAVKNGYLPLSGGTLSGNLIISDPASSVQIRRNVEPNFSIMNNEGKYRSMFLNTTTDGSVGDTIIRTWNSDSAFKSFTFAKDGQFTAPNDINSEGGLYAKGGIFSTTNAYPGLKIRDASYKQLALLQSNTANGGYSDFVIGVASKEDAWSYFTFKTNGIFVAPSDIISNGGILKSSRNTNPCLALTNQAGAWLASLAATTSDGSYGNTQLAVYKSATESSTFTFSNQGSFRAPNTVYSSLFAIQSNNFPQLTLQNNSGANLGILYMSTAYGSYTNACLRVYSSASAYSTFSFGNDGELSCGSLALTTALPISSGGTGSTTASGALANLGALPKSGGTITGALNIKNGTRFSEMHFAPSFDSSYAGEICYDAGGTGAYGGSTNFFVRQYSITTGSTSSSGMGKSETFWFPSTASGLTASMDYTIFTTKNPPSASQVGALPLTGGTLTGELHSSASNITITLNSNNDERHVLIQNNDHNENVYLYQSKYSRGIYSFCSDGTAIPVISASAGSNAWTFNGVANSANALNNTLAISKGGTGATTASDALTNLGALPITGGTLTGTLTAKALYASDGDVTGSHLVTKTNNYPEVYFKNAAGTALADFYVDTTSGGFADVRLKVFSDASTANYFTFGENGVFHAPSWVEGSSLRTKTNNYPELSLNNANGTVLAELYANTTTGAYAPIILKVNKDTSSAGYFTFGRDGSFTASSGITTIGNYMAIRNNSYPQLTFSNESGADIGKVFVSTTDGSYGGTKIRAYSSASAYYDFQFAGNGTFNCATLAPSNALGIAHGGTGATSASAARTALGITPANIGAAASSHTHSYLPLSGGTISGSIAVTGNVTSNGKSVYTAGGNVIYSSTQPTGSTGMIWLKPV